MADAPDLDTGQDSADAKRTERFWKLYEHLFGTPRPKDWKVFWHIQGLTDVSNKKVYFSFNGVMDDFQLNTVIHEMLHVFDPERLHGKEFEKEVRRLMRVSRKRRKRVRNK